MPNIHTFTTYKRTHTDIHITQNDMQEKLLLFILKWQMPVITMVFLSSLWLFSSLLYMQILTQLQLLQNEI
jgi:hypothetical protein